MTVRNEVADGVVPEAAAKSVLREGAVADIEGHLWWVDFASSSQSAEFFSNRTGMIAQPTLQTSAQLAVAVPQVLNAPTQLFQDSIRAARRTPEVPFQTEEQSQQQQLSKQDSNQEKQAKQANSSRQTHLNLHHISPVKTAGSRIFIAVPAIVATFLLIVAVFSSGKPPLKPADPRLTTTVVGIIEVQDTPDVDPVEVPSTGMIDMPTAEDQTLVENKGPLIYDRRVR